MRLVGEFLQTAALEPTQQSELEGAAERMLLAQHIFRMRCVTLTLLAKRVAVPGVAIRAIPLSDLVE